MICTSSYGWTTNCSAVRQKCRYTHISVCVYFHLISFIFVQAFTTEFRVHWGQHLLRPEFAESTYYLYKVKTGSSMWIWIWCVGGVVELMCWSLQATGDPYYLRVGQSIVEKLNAYARVPCGFAAVQDVRTGIHEDRFDWSRSNSVFYTSAAEITACVSVCPGWIRSFWLRCLNTSTCCFLRKVNFPLTLMNTSSPLKLTFSPFLCLPPNLHVRATTR